MWIKTDAGRHEMQTRGQVKERSRRNLLLLIDGVRSEQTLLATVDGVSPTDIEVLHALGLIARHPAHGSSETAARPSQDSAAVSRAWMSANESSMSSASVGAPTAQVLAISPSAPGASVSPVSPSGPTASASAAREAPTPIRVEAPAAPPDPIATTAAADPRVLSNALTQLIPLHLGLRGFTLTLAVEKAASPQELQDVARRVIDAVEKRKGHATAVEVRRALFGA